MEINYNEQKSKRVKLQIETFFMAYMFWMTVHMQREFWAMSKKAMISSDMNLAFFGSLDTALFMSYSIFQFFNGSIGDIFDKRMVLASSYLIQAFCFFMVGLAGSYHWQSSLYFHFFFVIIGITQSIVFPCLVAVVGGWFAKTSRGLITGGWGTSTNFGNIVGIQLAAKLVTHGEWQNLMYTITSIFVINAVLISTVFKPSPEEEGIIIEVVQEQQAVAQIDTLNESEVEEPAAEKKTVNFREAFMIPGVLQYGISFFCVKFAVYALLLWLPLFLGQELEYDDSQIANIATCYEIGNLFGGVTLGFISDWFYAKRSPVGFVAILISFAICIGLTFSYKVIQPVTLGFSLFILGILLGGMHHILCVTCSADLGAHKQATSSVTGIIDGMGSLGTAIGQFIIGHSVTSWGWKNGYLMIISFVIALTLIPMGKMMRKEL